MPPSGTFPKEAGWHHYGFDSKAAISCRRRRSGISRAASRDAGAGPGGGNAINHHDVRIRRTVHTRILSFLFSLRFWRGHFAVNNLNRSHPRFCVSSCKDHPASILAYPTFIVKYQKILCCFTMILCRTISKT